MTEKCYYNHSLYSKAISFIIILIFPISLCACSESESNLSREQKVEYIEQEAPERKFNDWTLEDIGFKEPVSIGKPVRFRIYNDRIFVWDAAPMSVKRYALNGDLEVTYGNGEGQGPGQFQHLSSFAVRDSQEVWTVDTRAGDISRFRYDGRLVDTFPTEVKPVRLTTVGKNRFVLQSMFEPTLFALLSRKGTIVKRFGKVLDVPQDRYTLILDGELYPNPQGGFIWAPTYASYLYFYSPRGALQRRIELIDGHPFPVEKMQPNPLQKNVDPWPQRTQAVSLTEDEIFVSVASAEPLMNGEDGPAMVLDRYDRSSGTYLDSKRIRVGGRNFHVHNGMVYGVTYSDTTLHKLRIHRSP